MNIAHAPYSQKTNHIHVKTLKFSTHAHFHIICVDLHFDFDFSLACSRRFDSPMCDTVESTAEFLIGFAFCAFYRICRSTAFRRFPATFWSACRSWRSRTPRCSRVSFDRTDSTHIQLLTNSFTLHSRRSAEESLSAV